MPAKQNLRAENVVLVLLERMHDSRDKSLIKAVEFIQKDCAIRCVRSSLRSRPSFHALDATLENKINMSFPRFEANPISVLFSFTRFTLRV